MIAGYVVFGLREYDKTKIAQGLYVPTVALD
jgi:hypothetical protein